MLRARDCPTGAFPRQAFDRRNQLLRIYRLGNIAVHAGRQTSVAVALHDSRRECNDWKMSAGGPFLLANSAGGGESIHFGHLDVHENDVEVLQLKGFDGFATVFDTDDRMPALLQNACGDALIHGVVFGQQNLEFLRRGSSRWLGVRRRPILPCWLR